MRIIAIGFLCVGVGAVATKFISSGGSLAHDQAASNGVPPVGSYQVTMYSNSDCSPCRLRAKQLTADGIAFVEHMMDRDPRRMEEMMAKLNRANLPTSGVTMPQLEINGVMMSSNPSMQAIRTQLAKR